MLTPNKAKSREEHLALSFCKSQGFFLIFSKMWKHVSKNYNDIWIQLSKAQSFKFKAKYLKIVSTSGKLVFLPKPGLPAEFLRGSGAWTFCCGIELKQGGMVCVSSRS